MASSLDKPRLRYLLAAFRYKQYADFGHVDLHARSMVLAPEFRLKASGGGILGNFPENSSWKL